MVQGRSPNNPLQRSDHDKVHAPDCCADGGFSGYAKLVFRAFIAAGVLVASQPGWAQVADSTPMQPKALEELAEVVITGEQAGPALWKVTKDGHALWIMATLSPLPKDITWRSRQVERVIGDSQEVYGDLFISFSLKGNDRDGQRMMRDAQLNAGGKTLKDVLPAAMYARFVALSRKYGGDKNLEKLRPYYAMQELTQKAMRKMGAKARTNAWSTGDVAALRADTGLYQPRRRSVVECSKFTQLLQHIRQIVQLHPCRHTSISSQWLHVRLAHKPALGSLVPSGHQRNLCALMPRSTQYAFASIRARRFRHELSK
jgi:hypothetical protein